MSNPENNSSHYLPRSGPMPRPESPDQAKDIIARETFAIPGYKGKVRFETKEFTSLCPRTGQPDFCTVIVEYIPKDRFLESKAMKFYLWAFRTFPGFSEKIAKRIADDLFEIIEPVGLKVEVRQNVRGGLGLTAFAEKGAWQ